LEDGNEPLCRERCYLEGGMMPLRRERCYREDRNEPLRRERCYREDRTVPLSRERCYLEDGNKPLRRERCYYEIRKRQLFVLYNKKQKIMAQKTLTTNYLSRLSNANHDGVTQQIDDRLQGFETENQLLLQAMNGIHTARQGEDTAYRRFSGKDFASDDLKREDSIEDKYMSAVLGILNGLLYAPAGHRARG